MAKALPNWKARICAKFMTTLNEYLGFFDKVDKRIRDEQVTEMLPKTGISQAHRLRRRQEKSAEEN